MLLITIIITIIITTTIITTIITTITTTTNKNKKIQSFNRLETKFRRQIKKDLKINKNCIANIEIEVSKVIFVNPELPKAREVKQKNLNFNLAFAMSNYNYNSYQFNIQQFKKPYQSQIKKDKSEIKTEIKTDKSEIKTEIKKDKSEIKNDKSEIKTEIKKDKSEIKKDKSEIKTEINNNVSQKNKSGKNTPENSFNIKELILLNSDNYDKNISKINKEYNKIIYKTLMENKNILIKNANKGKNKDHKDILITDLKEYSRYLNISKEIRFVENRKIKQLKDFLKEITKELNKSTGLNYSYSFNHTFLFYNPISNIVESLPISLSFNSKTKVVNLLLNEREVILKEVLELINRDKVILIDNNIEFIRMKLAH